MEQGGDIWVTYALVGSDWSQAPRTFMEDEMEVAGGCRGEENEMTDV